MTKLQHLSGTPAMRISLSMTLSVVATVLVESIPDSSGMLFADNPTYSCEYLAGRLTKFEKYSSGYKHQDTPRYTKAFELQAAFDTATVARLSNTVPAHESAHTLFVAVRFPFKATPDSSSTSCT